jgi:YegS/Rv2252/BmrU family lipid kinase
LIKVGIIINGSRKLKKDARSVLQMIDNSDLIHAEIITTQYQKHGTELAEKMAFEKDVIVAIGGDGTGNEVVQGIYNSGNRNVRLGIVPNGTGNDFLYNLPPFEPERFVRNLEELSCRKIDIGLVRFTDSERTFLNISDIGFGGYVIGIMNAQRKWNIGGKLSYSLAILRAFFSYRKQEVHLKGEGFEYQGKVLLAAFCNGSTFGHGLTINPNAKIDSNSLEITVIGNVSLLTYLRKLGDLKKSRIIDHPEAHYYTASSIEIKDNNQLLVEGDGELVGKGMVNVSVVPNAINLIV